MTEANFILLEMCINSLQPDSVFSKIAPIGKTKKQSRFMEKVR